MISAPFTAIERETRETLGKTFNRIDEAVHDGLRAGFRDASLWRGIEPPPDWRGVRESLARLAALAEHDPGRLQKIAAQHVAEQAAVDDDLRILSKPKPTATDTLPPGEILRRLDEGRRREMRAAIEGTGEVGDPFIAAFDAAAAAVGSDVRPETTLGAIRMLRHTLRTFLAGMTHTRAEEGVSPLSRPFARALAIGAGDALDLVVERLDQVERCLATATSVRPALDGAMDRLWVQLRASLPGLRVMDIEARQSAIASAKREMSGILAEKLLRFVEAIGFGPAEPDADGLPPEFLAGVDAALELVSGELDQLRLDVRTGTPAAALLDRLPDMLTARHAARQTIGNLNAEDAGEALHEDTNTKSPDGGGKD